MIFVLFLIVFAVFSFAEVFYLKTNWKAFNFFYTVLIFITAVRYGVGTDFPNYEYLYEETPDSLGIEILDVYHGEPGFLFLMFLFKLIGANFYIFNAFWAVLSMSVFYVGIKKFCLYPFFSLLIFYCVFYFTYPFNAIRQGLTIVLFFAIALDYLCQKKWLKYTVCTLLGSLFHVSLLFTLFFPILLRFKLNLKNFLLILAIALLLPVQKLLFLCTPSIFHSMLSFYSESDISLLGTLARLTFFLPILYYVSKIKSNDPKFLVIKNLYLWGTIIYITFFSLSFIASRLNVYTRILEVVLLPGFCMYFHRKSLRLFFFTLILVLLSYLYVKNINMLIVNSLLDISVFEYPLFYYDNVYS